MCLAKQGSKTVDNIRLLVWATFTLMLWVTYQAWITQYPTEYQETSETIVDFNEQPNLPVITNTELPLLEEPLVAPPLVSEEVNPQVIRVQTDVLDLLIDENGGDSLPDFIRG